MEAKKAIYLQEVDIQLTGQYDISTPGTFDLGNYFGLDPKRKIIGLRIPAETELVASPNFQGGAKIIPYSVLAGFCINLFNYTDQAFSCTDLPLTALQIDGSIEIKAGPWYEIDQHIDFSKCSINVCNPPAALPAGQFYNLTIWVYFQ